MALAIGELQRRSERAEPASWRVMERQERRRSTVFRVRIKHGKGEVDTYYKTDFVPPALDSSALAAQIERHRRSLLLEGDVVSDLRGRFARDSIDFDEPLALCPSSLTAVRVRVAGQPLGAAAGFALPMRRAHGRWLYRSLGRALRSVADVGGSQPAPADAMTLEEMMADHLQRAAGRLSRDQHSRARVAASRCLARIDAERALSWVHGDVSPSNVLRTHERVGIIDFSWAYRPRFHDLAQLVTRMEVESPRIPRWTANMIAELRTGYGTYGGAGMHEWRLTYLQRILRGSWSRRPAVRRWSASALQRSDILDF